MSTVCLLIQQIVILLEHRMVCWICTQYTYGDSIILYADCYTYLSLVLKEFLDYNITGKAVAAHGSRALGLAIAKCKILGGVEYHIFTNVWDILVYLIIKDERSIWWHTTLQRYNIEHYT